MTTQAINPSDISLSYETMKKLDGMAGKACKPGCECSKNEGNQCGDRWDRFNLLAEVTRQTEARARGWKPDWSDWTSPELSLLVTATARMLKLESPLVRRLEIMLRNNSARAAKIVRLYLDDKLSFQEMIATASRHQVGAVS